MKSPCGKNCPRRHYACHDTCEKYNAFVEYSRMDYERRRKRSEIGNIKYLIVLKTLKQVNYYKK